MLGGNVWGFLYTCNFLIIEKQKYEIKQNLPLWISISQVYYKQIFKCSNPPSNRTYCMPVGRFNQLLFIINNYWFRFLQKQSIINLRITSQSFVHQCRPKPIIDAFVYCTGSVLHPALVLANQCPPARQASCYYYSHW